MAKLKLLKIIFLVSGFLLFFLLISYCSNILLIGEKLGLVIHPSAEIIFDVLLLLVPLALIVLRFVTQILRYQIIPLNILDIQDPDEQQKKMIERLYKKHRNELGETGPEGNSTDKTNTLRKFFFGDNEKENTSWDRDGGKGREVDEKCHEITKWAFFNVILSQNRLIDTFSLLYWQIRLISEIMKIYNVRTNVKTLFKLYWRILSTSLIVGSMEEAIEKIAGSKLPFGGDIFQAVSTAVILLRTGGLTKYYIYHGLQGNSEDVSNETKKFAKKHLEEFLTNTGKEVGKEIGKKIWEKIKGIFLKSDKTTDTAAQTQ